MPRNILTLTWIRLEKWVRQRRVQNALTICLVLLGPVLAGVTFLALGGFELRSSSSLLRGILLADFVYVLVIAGLVARRVAAMISARRRRSAGSELHLRLTAIFALIAMVPTIMVAVFAALTLNFGLEGWFSDRVRQVVGNSLAAAQAYENEHRINLQSDAQLLANFMSAQKQRFPGLGDAESREILNRGQSLMQRPLKEAYLISGDAAIQARGERSYLFNYEPPEPEAILGAQNGEVVVIQDWDNNEFRALIELPLYDDRFLYVTRDVDGSILNLLDDTRETVALYEQLEDDRGRLLFEFALIYLGFALIVILAAIWLGLWVAERLSRPVIRLAGAAQRVGEGDLDVRVREEESDNEFSQLGRTFNRMTEQLKEQRDALLEANAETERRRRLFDSVLSGVTAGVIGLDGEGQIDVMNTAASTLLGLKKGQAVGMELPRAVPEFAEIFATLAEEGREVAQGEVQLTRKGKAEILLVRMATRRSAMGEIEGYVVTFDDVTDLVSAQRMAAWGDVARRIAHEIKNPLTPIQLSAERLRRKYGPLVGEERDTLEQYADVIVRQTNDLRRIVDEFSKFARMRDPDRQRHDLMEIVRDAMLLFRAARPGFKVEIDSDVDSVTLLIDETMINQALTNVLKNAGEAIDTKIEKSPNEEFAPEVRIRVRSEPGGISVAVQDNGIGLPDQRSRLFEPYVTHRDKGTGLGLSIVKKIVEEHAGTLELADAPVFEGNTTFGAEVRLILPVDPEMQSGGTEPAQSSQKETAA
ncbi:sensor histidine kinase NtrY-like [Oceanomicrobium pacificus]|uniref:histidine kinase n=1 Tax=Oceanomicrobium pacificus TaxID=2692916 RepID=A0A6B0TXL9_9RHOB|nr:PAS domain-containing sensor histidine kinase [Oceanomicrobium pacificus]MXU65763.1 HAMP domain-containing protein [Oceanomicrobium pacificus]